MAVRYRLDSKIEALNLLDRHDGDFRLVRELLGISVKTLENWRAAEVELRRKYDDRQYRHAANVKLELFNDMIEVARDIMKTIKAESHKDVPVSQRAYTLTTLLSHASKLEESYVELEPKAEKEEQANRIKLVDDDKAEDAPSRAESNPRPAGSPRGVSAREALEQIGIGEDRDLESGLPGTEGLLADRAQPADGEANLRRPGKKQRKFRRGHKKRKRRRR